MKELHDFGEKIGGARKDLWGSRGIILSDLDEMSVAERSMHIKKDNIWPRPNWEQQILDGKPQALAYWQNKMRQSIPPRPPGNDEQSQQNYVEVVGALRDAVMAVKEPYGIDTFYKSFLQATYVTKPHYGYYVQIDPIAEGIVTNKVLKAAQSKQSQMKSEAEKNLFGILKDQQIYVTTKNNLSVHLFDKEEVDISTAARDEGCHVLMVNTPGCRSYYYLREDSEFFDPGQWQQGTYFVVDNNRRQPLKINFGTRQEAETYIEETARARQATANQRGASTKKGKGGKRKTPFTPPQLRHIQRTGPNYRHLRSADSDLFLNNLKFRGGEFGNWLNHDDRQTSLNMGYDALRDLARILHIRPEDVSLNGSLAIAFGARGTGGANAAAAHYEPGRQVINLTKMSGAGCLAHEWAHALDHAIGLSCGAAGLASESKSKRSLPKPFTDLLSALQYKTVMVPAEELSAELAPKIEKSKQQLKAWIHSVKPANLPEDLTEAWEKAANAIVDSAESFTGSEYINFGRREQVLTKPEIEMLSQIRKAATNRGIPRDTKRQITMWAVDLKYNLESAKSSQPQERTVKTDFYKGSIEFDKIHSRAGHGYYQSTCEMFARAFDCYIADKLKAEGTKSDYLTAHADSFVIPGKDGKPVAAIPQGEERTLLNEKFDLLIDDLKHRGLLQDHEEVLEEAVSVPRKFSSRSPSASFLENKPDRSEQISFDDLLFAAQERSASAQPRSESPNMEISEQGRGTV